MSQFWRSSYPTGMPRVINVKQHKHIADMLSQCCEQYQSAVAFSQFGTAMTYAELEKKAKRLAAAWQQLGLKEGDRVALMLPNCLQYPVAWFGAFLAGLVVVNVNAALKQEELLYQLQEADPIALLVLDRLMPNVSSIMSSLSLRYLVVTRLGDCLSGCRKMYVNTLSRFKQKGNGKRLPEWDGEKYTWHELLSLGKKSVLKRIETTLDDLAVIQYTSATTGTAKGVMLTHQNIVANVMQAVRWVKPLLDSPKQATAVVPLPLYHIAPMTLSCFAFMNLGVRSLLVLDARRTRRLVRLFQKESIMLVVGTNTLFNALLSDPEFKYANFSQLRFAFAGGMPTQWSVANRWYRVTGVNLVEGYGLTEASPLVAANPATRYKQPFNSSAGLPIPNTEIKIVDDQGMSLPVSRVGEVCVKGPQVTTLGYWRKPEETAALYDSSGWLKTGDLGRLDDQGYLYLLERKQDVMLVSGFTVYPTEVEEALVSHPSVSEAAVVGVPDTLTGERVVAAVVLQSGERVSEDKLLTHCRDKMAAHKVPRAVVFCSSLPKSLVGKLLRRELRLMISGRLGALEV